MSSPSPLKFGFRTPWLTLRMRLPGLPRAFGLSTLLWLTVLAAVLFAWRRDHLRMQAEYSQLRGELFTYTKSTASWGVEQLVGPPDTMRPGDQRTAWASKTPDGQREWLIVDFERGVRPKLLEIHENYNPGALVQVSVFDPLGREVVVWRGVDPTPVGAAGGISKIPFSTLWNVQRVKLYFDSPTVKGWNEVDAVGLHDSEGQVHWAVNATASSTYGGRESRSTQSDQVLVMPYMR